MKKNELNNYDFLIGNNAFWYNDFENQTEIIKIEMILWTTLQWKIYLKGGNEIIISNNKMKKFAEGNSILWGKTKKQLIKDFGADCWTDLQTDERIQLVTEIMITA